MKSGLSKMDEAILLTANRTNFIVCLHDTKKYYDKFATTELGVAKDYIEQRNLKRYRIDMVLATGKRKPLEQDGQDFDPKIHTKQKKRKAVLDNQVCLEWLYNNSSLGNAAMYQQVLVKDYFPNKAFFTIVFHDKDYAEQFRQESKAMAHVLEKRTVIREQLTFIIQFKHLDCFTKQIMK